MDVFWLSASSEWLINLSAGWFAAGVIIIGKKPGKSTKYRSLQLTGNFILAILSIAFAVEIKRYLGVL